MNLKESLLNNLAGIAIIVSNLLTDTDFSF